jgi:hypothetical protein
MVHFFAPFFTNLLLKNSHLADSAGSRRLPTGEWLDNSLHFGGKKTIRQL